MVSANQIKDPARSLDSVPFARRLCIGFCALIAGAFLAFLGGAILYLRVAAQMNAGRGALLAFPIGSALVFVAIFLELIWLRLWFGSQPWLDAMINWLFWRSYIYIVALSALLLLLVFVHLLLR